MNLLTPLLQTTLNLNIEEQAKANNIPYAASGPKEGFQTFLNVVLGGLFVLGVVFVLLNLLWGAFDWISSNGEKSKLDSARNKMTGALMGLVVLAGTIAIFNLIQNIFGIEIFTFSGEDPAIGQPTSFWGRFFDALPFL